MKIVHISDTHGPKAHTKLNIPDCDVLIHSGDIGGRTTLFELVEFLTWFEKQPARKKILVAGNHDLILDRKWVHRQKELDWGELQSELAIKEHKEALEVLLKFDIVYLNNRDYVFEGVKFYGSPISPSFHRKYWAFNADPGKEILAEWAKIPSDVQVLITHGPVYNILDYVEDRHPEFKGEDLHVGDKDLFEVIKKRLMKLKLHCCGHIHENYGVVLRPISNKRRVLFSNGAILTHQGAQLITNPLIIEI